jgi:hypothetical protein
MSRKSTTAEERAEAAAMRTAAGAPGSRATHVAWEDVGRPCVIDDDAVQKYVLIQVHNGPETRFFVRGSESARYHKDAAGPFLGHLTRLGMPFHVLGGGRIAHQSAPKPVLNVYGFSYGFPWQGEPQHHITCRVLQSEYPGYDVSHSNEGY